MVKVFILSLIGLGFCTACGGPLRDNSAQIKAHVSAAQARQAFAIVAGIDYLPFAYVKDGCYARSLYMSMELAEQTIPSSEHYIWGDLRPNPDTEWSYHVAPLLQVNSEEPWILDPSLEAQPLRLSAWIGKNFPVGDYTTDIKPGSAYFDEQGRTRPFDSKHMVRNFAEMPTFLTGDIASACAVMYDYLGRERIDPKTKRALLLKRTEQLLTSLASLDKLQIALGETGTSLGDNALCDQLVHDAALGLPR